MQVTAFKANDGTLFLTEEEQISHDNQEVKSNYFRSLAETIVSEGRVSVVWTDYIAGALTRIFDNKNHRNIINDLLKLTATPNNTN